MPKECVFHDFCKVKVSGFLCSEGGGVRGLRGGRFEAMGVTCIPPSMHVLSNWPARAQTPPITKKPKSVNITVLLSSILYCVFTPKFGSFPKSWDSIPDPKIVQSLLRGPPEGVPLILGNAHI